MWIRFLLGLYGLSEILKLVIILSPWYVDNMSWFNWILVILVVHDYISPDECNVWSKRGRSNIAKIPKPFNKSDS